LVYWLIGLVALLVALYLLRTILLPFVAGFAVAYFLDPVADRLERWRAPRGVAAAIVLAVFFLLVSTAALLVLPVVQTQIVGLARNLPSHIGQLREGVLPAVLELMDKLGIDYRGEDVTRIDDWLPRPHRETVAGLMREIDEVMAGFVRGQGTVCLILGTFYAGALSLSGLDYGLIIGMLAGLMSFVPFVGVTVGLFLSLAQALMQFAPDFLRIGLVIAIFVAGQVAEGNFLTPRFLGNRVGLHPVWILFGLLAGAALFGFVGVLLAVPATAAVGVLARFAVQRYQQSRLYLGSAAVASEASTPAAKPAPEERPAP
jgi:predicted PurR-regulated permease PerM